MALYAVLDIIKSALLVIFRGLCFIMMTSPALPDRKIKRAHTGVTPVALHFPMNSEFPLFMRIFIRHPSDLAMAGLTVYPVCLVKFCGGELRFMTHIAFDTFRDILMTGFDLFCSRLSSGTWFPHPGGTPENHQQNYGNSDQYRSLEHFLRFLRVDYIKLYSIVHFFQYKHQIVYSQLENGDHALFFTGFLLPLYYRSQVNLEHFHQITM